MADDAAVFLCDAGEEARRIDEGHERDVEAIAHAYEAGHLVGGIDVNDACHDGGFLTHNAHTVTADARQTHDRVAGPIGLDFKERALVDDLFDDLMHDVGFGGLERDDAIERFIHAQGVVIRFHKGRIFDIVRGQVRKEVSRHIECRFFRGHAQMRHTADSHMHTRPAQRFGIDHFTGHSFDHFGPGEEHERLFLDHDNQVGQCRGVGCATRAWAKHHADLWHHARVLCVAPEDLGVAAHRAHAFLNARPT